MEIKEIQEEINLNFYSRQIGTFGLNTMKKLSRLNIIIFGLKGLGIEIAKNIILTGPNKVLIYDYHISKINDLNSNFYLEEKDINNKRLDEAVLEKLKNLNDNVDVEIFDSNEKLFESSDIINEEIIFNYFKTIKIVIITEICNSNIIKKIENYCYENNKGFIYCGCLGLLGFIYNNFGKKFIINEPYLGQKRTYYINQIKWIKEEKENENNNNKFIQLLIEYENNMKDTPSLQKGDFITFKEIEGLEFLNQKDIPKIFKVEKVNNNDSIIINIEGNSNYEKFIYKKGGIITEYIYPIEMEFNQFDDCLENPTCDLNIINFSSNQLNHSLIYSVQKYYDKNLTLPEFDNDSQLKIIINETKNFFDKKVSEKNKKDEKENDENDSKSDDSSSCSEIEMEIDLNLGKPHYLNFNNKFFDINKITNLSRWLRSKIPPICSFFGGIVSQEIVKFTGKYIPINQFFWYDFYDSIKPFAENEKIYQNNNKNLNRYRDQILIFGDKIQEMISKSNIFIIGAGALGCEYLKNLAMMGFSSSDNNKIIVTDNDNIEISNLNRQFLFNKNNVGRSKSKCACLEAKKMNPSCNFEDKQLLVHSETENVFNTKFWESQNFVLNAVDNIKARHYIDSQTTLFKIPLIETATEGLKAHCQIIIPYLTQNYSERDYNQEEENNINTHSCTLKQFPYLVEHCIEWGKLHFEKYFNRDIENLANVFLDINKIINELKRKDLKSKLNKLKKYIWYFEILNIYYDEKNEKKLIENIMGKSIEIFYKLFNIKIKRILDLYPIDFMTEDGNYFWSGTKRAPNILEYDINDKLSFEFMKSFIILFLNSLSLNLSKYNIKNINFGEELKNIYLNDFSKNNEYNSKKIIIDSNKIKDKNYKENQINEEIKIYEKIFQEKVMIIKNKSWFNIESINPIIFEKDNDSNHHIEFINACSNLRARNYKIEECSHLDTKLISGKIIPAVASTTSIIVGYACCLLLTLLTNQFVNSLKNEEKNNNKLYKNYNLELFHEIRFNLADNFYMSSVPPKIKIFETYKIINVEYISYKKYKHLMKKNKEKSEETNKKIKKYIKIMPKPEPFSVWDNLIINESYSFNELKNYFKSNYQVNLNGIYSLDKKCLTSNQELFDTKIEILMRENIENNKREFILFYIDADDDDGNIIKFPIIKYNLLE